MMIFAGLQVKCFYSRFPSQDFLINEKEFPARVESRYWEQSSFHLSMVFEVAICRSLRLNRVISGFDSMPNMFLANIL